uniref:Abhydrolase_3 domain-containing protein n=1 Tax=Parastrongyloides trichosuri TaxID=131310 RepID=A0A0N4Z144_PARTI
MWLLLTISIPILFYTLYHKPIPSCIDDYYKVSFFTILIRISHSIGVLLEQFKGLKGFNFWERIFTVLLFSLPIGKPKWLKIEDITISNIPCRVYIPLGAKRKNNNGIIFAHGGGWCIMKAKYSDLSIYSLVRYTGSVVISIDYSLSPEARFGVAINECENVIKEFYNNYYKEFNVDRNKISVMGESAGGNLVIAATLRLCKNNNVPINKLVLVYPVTGVFNFLLPSYQFYNEYCKDNGMLSPENMIRWILLYLGLEDHKNAIDIMRKNGHISKRIRESENFKESFNVENLMDVIHKEEYIKGIINYTSPDKELSKAMEPYLLNPEFCPLMATKKELSHFPPTFVLTTNYDILRDEGILFAHKLKLSGVSVQNKNYMKGIHGSMTVPLGKVGLEMSKDIANFIDNCS